MVPSVPLSPSVHQAFTNPSRDASTTARAVEHRDGCVHLHEAGDSVLLARPNGEGTPYAPTLSADGTRAAWLRRAGQGPEHIEVIHVHTGFLGSLRRLTGTQYIHFSRPVKAIDLDARGTTLACLTPDRLIVYPLQRHGPHREVRLPAAAPGAHGVRQHPRDVECLEDGRAAVWTDAGTAYLVGPAGVEGRLSLPHPDNHAADALPEAERRPLLDAYGDTLLGVLPGPDPRHCAVQVRDGADTLHLALDRQTGELREVGRGPAAPVLWSPDGRFLAVPSLDGRSLVHPVTGHARPIDADLRGARWTDDSRGLLTADGRSVPLSSALTAWEVDLGASAPQGGEVVRQDDHVVINGIRVARRG